MRGGLGSGYSILDFCRVSPFVDSIATALTDNFTFMDMMDVHSEI
jgi:hypothetical protein